MDSIRRTPAIEPANPYDPSRTDAWSRMAPDVIAPRQRWPAVICICLFGYFVVSAVTLPFSSAVWFGEVPPLALIQLPKSFFKSTVQHALMLTLDQLARSPQPFSVNYRTSHGWAMNAMVSVPAVFVCGTLALMRPRPPRRLFLALVICAGLDGVVTLWFDSVSNFKLYNAIYW